MEYRTLGGLRVPALGLGSRFLARPGMDPRRALEVVHAALDAGITFFDTADTYGRGAVEELLGRALRGHRHEVVIATKVGMKREALPPPAAGAGPGGEASPPVLFTQDAGAAHLCRAAEESLRRLGTDHVDLLLVHWPDPATPREETLEALDRLVRQGKAGAVGLCNFGAAELEAWFSGLPDRPGAAQPVALMLPYNPVLRDAEGPALDLARRHGMGLLACTPLLTGMLAREQRDGPAGDGEGGPLPAGYAARLARAVAQLRGLGRDWGMTPAQAVLAWVLERPGVAAVLAGATRPEQVWENAGAVRPLPDEMRELLDGLAQEPGAVPPLATRHRVLDCTPSPWAGHCAVLSSGFKLALPEPVRPGWQVELDRWRGTVLRVLPPEG